MTWSDWSAGRQHYPDAFKYKALLNLCAKRGFTFYKEF